MPRLKKEHISQLVKVVILLAVVVALSAIAVVVEDRHWDQIYMYPVLGNLWAHGWLACVGVALGLLCTDGIPRFRLQIGYLIGFAVVLVLYLLWMYTGWIPVRAKLAAVYTVRIALGALLVKSFFAGKSAER